MGPLNKQTRRERYAQINGFERLHGETGNVILKFMVHVSKDEQRGRLQARIDDPKKRWKFSATTGMCGATGSLTSQPMLNDGAGAQGRA